MSHLRHDSPRRFAAPDLGMIFGMRFPDAAGENLAGQECIFPRDFQGARTIALVAFDLRQRDDIETWLSFIDRFARTGAARGRLFPVLPRAMENMRRMVATTMRKGAPSSESREATTPLFVDIDAFCAALDIADRTSIHTFVVESDGSISVHRTGPYDESAGGVIEAQIGRPALS